MEAALSTECVRCLPGPPTPLGPANSVSDKDWYGWILSTPSIVLLFTSPAPKVTPNFPPAPCCSPARSTSTSTNRPPPPPDILSCAGLQSEMRDVC